MKITSRFLIIAVCGTALLLLAGLLVSRAVRRQNNVKSAQFAQPFTQAVQQLREKVNSIQKKMKRNESMIPTVGLAASPATGTAQQVAEKNHPLILQGIAWNEDKLLAMIEGNIIKPGDEIGGCIILEILPKAIILRDADGVQRRISLFKEDQF